MDNGLVNTLTMKEGTEAASESGSAEQSQGAEEKTSGVLQEAENLRNCDNLSFNFFFWW